MEPPGKIAQALALLDRFTNYEREAKYPYTGAAMNLERVSTMLALVGSPEKKIRAIHLAGTKGKGSTARMIESTLSSAGCKTGLYTSPHLLSLNERIQVNDEMISDFELAGVIDGLRKGVDAVHARPELGEVSWFELLTAAAFAYFVAKKADYAVLETGLGGRFDATNVCAPAVTVITPISLDHTDLLGDTIAKIALEKAMIIKPGCPVVMAPQPAAAREVILKRAEQMGAELLDLENLCSWKMNYIYPREMGFDLSGGVNLPGLKTRMVGPVQMINAAAAALVCGLLRAKGAKISDDTIRYGLGRARLAARFQVSEIAGRTVVLDGAHNPESGRALAETLGLVFPGRKFHFAVGMGRDKDLAGFFEQIKPLAQSMTLCRASHARAASPEELRHKLGDFAGKMAVEPLVASVLGKITGLARPDEIVVITGSFFLVGEALQWMVKKKIEIQIP